MACEPSGAGHPGRRPRASYRASGWLVRYLTRLSRVQVREARSMCYGEHTSQSDTFGPRVVAWPVSPAGHPGRRPRASCRAPWLSIALRVATKQYRGEKS